MYYIIKVDAYSPTCMYKPWITQLLNLLWFYLVTYSNITRYVSFYAGVIWEHLRWARVSGPCGVKRFSFHKSACICASFDRWVCQRQIKPPIVLTFVSSSLSLFLFPGRGKTELLFGSRWKGSPIMCFFWKPLWGSDSAMVSRLSFLLHKCEFRYCELSWVLVSKQSCENWKSRFSML